MFLFRRSFAVDSELPPEELRARIRLMVDRRLLPETKQFQVRQIGGWAYDELGARFTLRPDRWSGQSIFGAYFVGHVESACSGSRIVGYVREHWLTQLIVTLLLVSTIAMTVASLKELPWIFSRDVARVATIPAIIVAGSVLLVRFDLRAVEQMICDGIALAQSVVSRNGQ